MALYSPPSCAPTWAISRDTAWLLPVVLCIILILPPGNISFPPWNHWMVGLGSPVSLQSITILSPTWRIPGFCINTGRPPPFPGSSTEKVITLLQNMSLEHWYRCQTYVVTLPQHVSFYYDYKRCLPPKAETLMAYPNPTFDNTHVIIRWTYLLNIIELIIMHRRIIQSFPYCYTLAYIHIISSDEDTLFTPCMLKIVHEVCTNWNMFIHKSKNDSPARTKVHILS